MHGLGKWVPSPSLPRRRYCCHRQGAHGLFQTRRQDAEARVAFFPVRSLSTQQPLPPQALTSIAPSASQQEEELNVIFAVGRMDTFCAEMPGTSNARLCWQ